MCCKSSGWTDPIIPSGILELPTFRVPYTNPGLMIVPWAWKISGAMCVTVVVVIAVYG